MRDLIDGPARRFAKTVAERVLTTRMRSALHAHRGRGDTIVLAYHNIVPAGQLAAGERTLHLEQRVFAEQLDLLAETHTVVGLGEVLTRPAVGARPRAVITFDDAYRGALTAGVEELQQRNLPATFFVSTDFIPNRAFWWDSLAPVTGEVPNAFRSAAIGQHRGIDASVRRAAPDHGLTVRPVPEHARTATLAELEAAGSVHGITFGSHTRSHPNLATLYGDELDAELGPSLEWLRARFSCVVPWLSYPYGRHSVEVEHAAISAGFEGALRIDGGWAARDSRAFSLPRVNVPNGLTQDGFLLRTSGVLSR